MPEIIIRREINSIFLLPQKAIIFPIIKHTINETNGSTAKIEPIIRYEIYFYLARGGKKGAIMKYVVSANIEIIIMKINNLSAFYFDIG